MRRALLAFLSCLALQACAPAPPAPPPPPPRPASIEDLFTRLRQSPPEALEDFLKQMPKGADLHSHLSGAVYAEDYLALAAAQNYCISPTYDFTPPENGLCPGGTPVAEFLKSPEKTRAAIAALSMPAASGYADFGAIFRRVTALSQTFRSQMLAAVMKRAQSQNILYLELMLTPPGMASVTSATPVATPADFDASYQDITIRNKQNLESLLATSTRYLDEMEKETARILNCPGRQFAACPVKIRYQAQIIRYAPTSTVFAQTAFAFALMQRDPRVVGLNMVGPETFLPPETLRLQMDMLANISARYPQTANHNISLHAGELPQSRLADPEAPPLTPITDAVETAHATRIGHGLSINREINEAALLWHMAQNHICVELALTSNASLMRVTPALSPFETYRAHHVPITLATDDEGLFRSPLSHEYALAARQYALTYAETKTLSRNSLEYAFLPGKSLWQRSDYTAPLPACTDMASPACAAAVAPSPKATLQRQLELRLTAFEAAALRP